MESLQLMNEVSQFFCLFSELQTCADVWPLSSDEQTRQTNPRVLTLFSPRDVQTGGGIVMLCTVPEFSQSCPTDSKSLSLLLLSLR